MLKTLQDHPTYTADLVGFTDDIGTARKNVTLSWQREEMVRRYLAEKGVALDRLYFIGLGEGLGKDETPYARAKDRNVTIMIYRPA